MPSLKGKRGRGGQGDGVSLRSSLSRAAPLSPSQGAKRTKFTAVSTGPGSDPRFATLIDVLTAGGLVLVAPGGLAGHILKTHTNQVIKTVTQLFQADLAYPEKVNAFNLEAQAYLENPEALNQALMPCQSEVMGVNPQEDSLVRVLLKIEEVQPTFLPWLLEQLALIALNEDENSAGLSLVQRAQQINVPRLILSQVSWLNKIVHPESLADKITEILDAVPTKAQFDVISALPEIIDEAFHGKIAMFLRDMMKQKTELSSTILEAFTNLSLDSDILGEIQSSILKTLGSIRFEDLPVNVKFVLQSMEPGEESHVIKDLRETLDIVPPQILTQATQRKLNNEIKDVSKMILDLIRNEFYGRRKLIDAWFRAIEGVKTSAEHKTLDVMVLLIIHSFPNRCKHVQSLFKNKVRASLFTEDLISKTLNHHKTSVKEMFEDIMGIAEALSMTLEPSLNQCAVIMYREMFLNLDRFCKQDLIGDLVSKLSSGGSPSLRRTSIRTLAHLTFDYTVQLVPFSMFVASILDHVVSLDLADVRPIMDILSFLAYSKAEGESSLQDNLQIVISKQIASTNLKIRRMGITSAVMTVKNMSNDPMVEECGVQDPMGSQITTTSANSTMVSISTLRQARDILDNVCSTMKSAHDIGGLFMDELSVVMQSRKLHKKLEKWVANTMTNDFEDEFVVDIAKEDLGVEKQDYIPIMPMYNLEDPEDLAIVLNIVPLLIQASEVNQAKSKSTAISRLIPHFRLLIKCTKALKGNDLSDVDALLSCPVLLPSPNVIEKFESLSFMERNVTCSALFYGANWIREVLNAFANHEAEEPIKHRILNRLKTLVKLEEDLKACLRFHSSFIPPTVLHMVEVSGWKPPTSNSGGRGRKIGAGAKGKGIGKGRKRKSDEDSSQSQSVQNESQKNVTQVPQKEDLGDGSTVIELDYYAPFFREFDLDVFAILSFDTVTIESELDWDQEIVDPKLRPSDLILLLKDLHSKLSHTLVSSRTKKGFPGKTSWKELTFSNLDNKSPKEVAQFAINHLDFLLGDLEAIAEYFKRLIDINDGVLDCANMFHDGTPIICECFQILFILLKVIFSWNGFLGHDQRPLLREGLHMMARRINSKIKLSHPTSELAAASISYLAKFSDWILIIGIASAQTKLMDHLLQFTDEDSPKALLAERVESYLKREWRSPKGQSEKGSLFNSHVESLLKTYLRCSENPVQAMGAYIPDEFTRVAEGKGKDAVSEMYPTLSKSTFGIHHRIFLETLAEHGKSLIYGASKNHEEHLEVWMVVSVQLFELLKILKVQSSNRGLLRFALKYSRLLLDHFLKHGMPVVDRMFRKSREDSITLLKNMQQSTRLLQHACSHSKIFKDVSLAKHVPMLKKTLETFVYRVKSMLALNDAVDAFWLGTLKTRDLSGKEILSQTSVESEEEEVEPGEEGDEDALPEEDQSDVELDDDASSEKDQNDEEDADDGDKYV
ncbi:hypothetical protein TCAL_01763 [Tigriopus californicus]|uniref:Fanconi anemia group D2 protein n=1 Tax=Tigriopus californicus TaxID=6832 RepID=A0A553N9G8_TIGCA|nr:Fanconi anemia group D2 protein homolog [Tigriopus californicus]TRY62096.1 hypothetical protein TCAL_01763 [Tigriopus californicus]|eukprot:TCALIF_01763-PA protein Name:"Similar to Fancd2 Fanconi anemia group D2 protein homolog (Rattus norvegicus)" AED:0.00 eAED:0.00 QI:17/1/1/1/1/1/2/111/1460